MDNETRSGRHRRRIAAREEQDPQQLNVYRRMRPKKSKNNDDEAGPSRSRDPPLDNMNMEDPPLYQNTSNVDPTWSVPPVSQQGAWYAPPAAEETQQEGGWPMWAVAMGGQTNWSEQEYHVEEEAQEQAQEQEDATQSRRPRQSRARNAIEPNLVVPVAGGPLIPELLRSFTAHTAYFIYQGIERQTLTFQLRQEQLRKWVIDEEFQWSDLSINTGITHLQHLMYSYVDQSLISAFLERWQPETNSFHMPFGEMTITLLDVYMILALRIQGQGMRLPIQDRGKSKTELYNQQALKAIEFFSLTAEMARNGVTSDGLKRLCLETDGLEDEKIASGYLWYLMASTLFPDKSQHMLPMPYVHFVRDMDRANNLSWGSGALAFMYRSLGECTRHECRQMSTCYTLLLAWIYQYFPSFRPQANPAFHNDVPFAGRWCPVQTRSRHRRNYREELDLMQATQIDWQPYGYVNYDDPDYAPAFFHGVISFLKITEPYMPDRVSRQFGVVQGIPRAVIEPIKAHRAPTLRSYIVQYDPSSNWSWDARSQHSIWVREMGPPAVQGYECSAEYMDWYIPRTHPFVRPENAGIRDPVQVIGQAMRRLNPFYNAEEEQFYNMRTAVRECIQDFRPYNAQEEEDDD